MKLLIYIPTFEREAALKEQLGRLIPQLSADVTLMVNDNNSSSYDVFELEKASGGTFQARKNKGNIHGNANILLGFIFANDFDYLWVLSDNDIVAPNCLTHILTALESRPDYLVFSKAHIEPSKETVLYENGWFVTTGIMGLISAGIYCVDSIRNQIYQGFYYHNSSFPHLAIILGHLREAGEASVSVLPQGWIIESDFEVKQANYLFSAVGLPQLYSLIHPAKQLEFLRRWLTENHIPYFVAKNQFPDSWLLTKGIVGRFPQLRLAFAWYAFLGFLRRRARAIKAMLKARK